MIVQAMECFISGKIEKLNRKVELIITFPKEDSIKGIYSRIAVNRGQEQ